MEGGILGVNSCEVCEKESWSSGRISPDVDFLVMRVLVVAS